MKGATVLTDWISIGTVSSTAIPVLTGTAGGAIADCALSGVVQPTGIRSTLAATNEKGRTGFHPHTARNAVIMSFALPGGYAPVLPPARAAGYLSFTIPARAP